MPDPRTDLEGDVLTERRTRSGDAGTWNVVVLNDDYSTMDFVILVFERIFHHTPAAAANLMLRVHTEGRAVGGTYTRDIAETKVEEVISLARASGHPLLAILEPA